MSGTTQSVLETSCEEYTRSATLSGDFLRNAHLNRNDLEITELRTIFFQEMYFVNENVHKDNSSNNEFEGSNPVRGVILNWPV
jgi:hypothetical protein